MRKNRWNCGSLIKSMEETVERIRLITSAICEAKKDDGARKKHRPLQITSLLFFFPKISLLDIIQIGTEQSKPCPIIIQLNTASIIISYNWWKRVGITSNNYGAMCSPFWIIISRRAFELINRNFALYTIAKSFGDYSKSRIRRLQDIWEPV